MKSKVVLITGAASGIGEASARLFASQGALVVLSDLREQIGQAVSDSINRAGGRSVFFKADVSIPGEVKDLVSFTLETYGRLDVAVNNAGISGESNPIAEMSVEGWEKVIAVNLNSLFYGMKYEIAEMLKTGGGSIVNVASILGQVGFEGSAGYVTAKHGAIGLTKTAALEYSSRNIRVNVVGPGFIETPLLNGLDEEVKQQLIALHPLGRLGRSEEVAEIIYWLSSEKASFVSGSYHPVDGAYLAR